MVVVSARHVGGTRGSGIVSSAADVLWMSAVRGMRGVGGECTCLDGGGVGVEGGGEWMRRLGLGFSNLVGTGEVLDVCRCFGCGCVGGIGGECVGGLDQCWRGGVVLCLCAL